MAEDTSPQEKLKQLSKLIEEKEKRAKELKEEEKKTKKELEDAKKEADKEIEELRKDDEIRDVAAQIAHLESQGMSDSAITSHLGNLGINRGAIVNALRLHNVDCEIHDHEIPQLRPEDESIDDLVADVQTNNSQGNVIYDLHNKMQEGITMYDMSSKQMYNTIQEIKETVANRGGQMSPNEYDIMKEFQDHIQEKQGMYQDSNAYLQRENEVIESIKGMGLKIGDSYLQNDDNPGY